MQGDDLSARVRVLVEASILDPPGCILYIRQPYPVHAVKVERVALVATFVRQRTNICPAEP